MVKKVKEEIKKEFDEPKRLNLGSGYRKINGWINLDIRPECEPDIVCNVEEGLPFEDNSISEIRCWDFLEHIHIGKTIFVMEEIYRVLKPEGRLEFFVPSTDGRGAFQDPTHVSFWNRNSFFYFSDDAHRNLYNIKAKFNFITMNNLVSDNSNHIIHIHGVGFAIKE